MKDRKKELETILVIVTGLLIIYYFSGKEFILIAAIILGLLSLVFKDFGRLITWLWYKLAELLGQVMSRVILTLVYYLLLFPISLLYRIGRKNLFSYRMKEQKSIWSERNFKFSRDDLKKPY